MSEVRSKEKRRHDFTPDEMNRLREELVSATSEEFRIQAERKMTIKQIAADLQANLDERFKLQEKIRCGYEEYEIEVITLFNEPARGKKRVIDAATGEIIRDVDMTPEELRQGSLDFSEE